MTYAPTLAYRPVQAFTARPALRFGKTHDDICMTTDFQDEASTFEAERRMRDVTDFIFANKQALMGSGWLPKTSEIAAMPYRKPNVQFVSDVPNIDSQALALQRLGGSRPNNDVFVHVTDPGVGVQATHDRAILVTDRYGIYVGPNNGSLGLVAKSLESRGENYRLLPIDFVKVRDFERLRTGNPAYQIPHTFHGRDVFAVVAAAIANGVEPEKFQDDKRAGITPINRTPFSQCVNVLPLNVGDKTAFYGLRDKTMGDIKSDLSISLPQRDALIKDNAQFRLYWQNEGRMNQLTMPFKGFFSQVNPHQFLCYAGSTYSPLPGAFLVDFAENQGNLSDRIGLPAGVAQQMTIERIS